MDKQLINASIAGGLSLAYSIFGEGMGPTDPKAITQALVIGGSYFANEMIVKPFLLPHVQLTHNALIKGFEEHIFDIAIPAMAYALSASQLGISTGSTVYDALRGAVPSLLASPAHTLVESFMPKV